MILDKSKFNLLKVVLSFSIGIFLVYYSLGDFEVKLFFESISRANISLIFFSMSMLLLSIQLRAIRWKFILNKKIKVNDLYKAQLVGYMGNNIFPLRFGELLKSFYVEKKNSVSRYEVFGSVFIERFLDFLGLDFDFHGVKDKLFTIKDLCEKEKISLNEIAYIGDDINCFELLSNS